MKNILIGVLVIGILILGYLFIKQKDKPADPSISFDFSEQTNSSPVSTNQNPPATPTNNPPVTSTPTTPPTTNPNWTEERFGWYYPPGWDGYSMEISGDSFGIFNVDTGTQIQVGGFPGTNFESSCEQNQLGDFQYGVSTQACIRGTLISLVNVSARWAPSQEEKNIFGDFVIRNR